MTDIRAVRIDQPGGPNAIRVVDHDLPDPAEGQVRVRHEAVGVNFIDVYHRTGLYPLELPTGLGLEAAGTVEAIGSGIDGFAEGDRVGYCTGPIGAYASHANVPIEKLVHLPDGIYADTAASAMLKAFTVQYLVRQIYRVGEGDVVLFHAGAGGVGQIAIQWLKHLGATVITTCSTDDKAETVRSLGADHVIRYDREDIASRVGEITGGRGVPVVYDGVGKSTFEASLDSLRAKGLFVSFGNASGAVTNVDLGIFSGKGSLFMTRPTLMHYADGPDALVAMGKDVFDVIGSGAVKIAAPTVYALDDAAKAHDDLENRRTQGSLILKP